MDNAIHRVKSKKRTSISRQVASAKRLKRDSSSDKTLHELPLEMLECILVKAIAMEVKSMKLSKSVWKEKADLVINRMRSVCPYWNSILTTNFFRIELHRALEAHMTIRLEILHQSLIQCYVSRVTTLKDDVLLFCHDYDQDGHFVNEIRVYDRKNMMAGVKEIIPFSKIRPAYVEACNVSNCIYVLEQHRDLFCSSVFRFTREGTYKWKVETWISDLDFSISFMSVSVKGNLIIRDNGTTKIYGPNGLLLHDLTSTPERCFFGYGYADFEIQKSNGNLVLVSRDQHHRVLTEIDPNGIKSFERKYKSSLSGCSRVNFADVWGRILIYDSKNGIELLDSELNLLDFTGPKPNQGGFKRICSLHYNSERNEVMAIYANDHRTSALAIFHFTEE